MRISELSRASGVPSATIKYYLREGLLHEGQLTSATQATYDDSHIARLALVRALVGAGGLSLAATRRVLEELDSDQLAMHPLLGMTQDLFTDAADEGVDTTRALRLVAELGWESYPESPAVRRLAVALQAIESAGVGIEWDHYLAHGRAMETVAARDVAEIPSGSRAAAVRYVVLGSILMEPVLGALRQLAHIDASARRFG
ncbi:MAG: MerR family transcriptional regulator [Propionibacteriaceae bacterium]